ncbi:uncharacterized protein At4g14100-like [Impatiens glandulifera]|uniref:uncharacterized protein At4g14100-like n=1 Tax=Impatiens glandulifera TaxID=253017 RepID=UPI001FB0F257|nr:uncharacterized protein At4g14100-like [Impatiens glandulifera]
MSNNNNMALATFFIVLSLFLTTTSSSSSSTKPDAEPVPTPWPLQFHAILFMNRSGNLQHTDLWYDWTNGRNFNIIQNQLGKLTYDLEWNNGTSFYYTLDKNKECTVRHFDVGILRPNWLDGANYLGQKYIDGFLCNVWEKVNFIWYYEDVATNRPVYWMFFSGFSGHVMTFEVGKVLEDAEWQAPVYCFNEDNKEKHISSIIKPADDDDDLLMRDFINTSSMQL